MNINCLPALAQLGSHTFPVPNLIAFTLDNRQLAEAYQCGDFKAISYVQSRLQAQMHVYAALQQFRGDASLTILTANDPQFEQHLIGFIEQQRQLDSSLSNKTPQEDELVECLSPPGASNERRFSLEKNANCGSPVNLAILNKLPPTAKFLTAEELERQIMGNC
jgi:hypothetical protein